MQEVECTERSGICSKVILRGILFTKEGLLRATWRLVLFFLLLQSSYVVWLLLLNTLVGNKIYSFLESLGEYASLLIPTIVITFVLVHYIDKRPWNSLGLSLNYGNLLVFTGGCLLGVSIPLISYFTRGLQIWGINSQFVLGEFWVYGLVLLGAATLEEIIFRGYLLQTLQVILKRNWLAVLISAVLFGAAHLGGGNGNITPPAFFAQPQPLLTFMDTSIVGALLGISYLRSRALLLPIGLHFAINFSTMNILSAPLGEKFRNGFLIIDPKAQLLNAQWPLSAFSPNTNEILADVVVYLVVVGLLFLWPFKLESALGKHVLCKGKDR